MQKLSPILKSSSDNGLAYWCPACNMAHHIHYGDGDGPRWQWDLNVIEPTIKPDILVRWPSGKDPIIYNVCHSTITNGIISYSGECTHSLTNTEIPMVSWPEDTKK